MDKQELCYCGKPLHYSDGKIEEMVRGFVRDFGPDVIVDVGGSRYLVPRHYIALHGLKAQEVPHMGFPIAQ